MPRGRRSDEDCRQFVERVYRTTLLRLRDDLCGRCASSRSGGRHAHQLARGQDRPLRRTSDANRSLPLRTLRLVSETNKALLVSENLRPDSLRGWHDKVLAEFDKHPRASYVFGNSILLEQSRMENAMGYALTLADTNGVARSVILDTGTLAEFLDPF